MVIALLAVLGVDLVVIVIAAACVLSRRRWVKRQPGAFRGAMSSYGSSAIERSRSLPAAQHADPLLGPYRAPERRIQDATTA